MININKYKLSNGLCILHSENNTTQNVTLNLTYHVGAKNEDPNKTGLAHLFEHLMFCGSKNAPDFDAPLESAGGSNNAYTTNDITNFYLTLPKQNIELGFWLEADRMLQPNINQNSLDIQRKVVIEEFKQSLNEPYGDLSALVRKMCYKTHPYAWSTIGKSFEQIENLTIEDIKDFFKQNYCPNNAILSIVGNIPWKETLRLSKKWFSDIPAQTRIKKLIPKEELQTKERRSSIEGKVPHDRIYKHFHMDSFGSEGYATCDCISDILANGASSRFIENLVKKQAIFTHIDASVSNSLHPGLFRIVGQITEGRNFKEAEAAINKELEKLCNCLIKEKELEKVKNKFESNAIFSLFDMEFLASEIAYHELTGKAEQFNDTINKYKKVNPEQIRTKAKQLFALTNSNTILYHKTPIK